MSRARSNSSASSALQQRRARKTLDTELVECDGVNLYERAAPSAAHERMLARGRERVAATLARPVAADAQRRPASQVVWLEELSEGARVLDKFRVTSESPDGFTHAERSALERVAYRVVRGSSDTVLFVLIDHARYDTRLLACCDLMPGQTLLLLALYTLSLTLFVYTLRAILDDSDLGRTFFERIWHEATDTPIDPLHE